MAVQSVPSPAGITKAPYASFSGKSVVTGITITLPLASAVSGHLFFFKKTDPSGNSVTIDAGAGTIDGAQTLVLSDQYDAVIIQSDGSNYHILAGFGIG